MDWFYQDKYGHAGPVSAEAIHKLLKQGLVSIDTLVWNKTFGSSWKPIAETDLAHVLSHAPPPLPAEVGPVARRRRRWLKFLLVPALVLFWLLGGHVWILRWLGVDIESALSNQVPACGSSTAKALAKQAMEGAPIAKVLNINVFDIQDARELSYEDQTKKRACTATALLNSGRHEFGYTLEWTNLAERKVWLEIQKLPF